MNQNQHSSPVGSELSGSFSAPSSGGNKTKRNDIQNLPAGLNPGIIFALVDIGTQTVNYGKGMETKRQVYIGIEHPQLKQFYYYEDTERRSHMTSKESTFSLAPKAFLRKVVEAVVGRKMSDQEADSYDLRNLLGCRVGVITQPSGSYDNIDGVMAYNQALPADFTPENDYWFFYIDKDPSGAVIGNNFRTQAFANLPGFIKKKIKASQEAQAYASKGGTFAENNSQNQPQQQGNYQNQQPQQQQQQYQQPQQQMQQQPQNQGQNYNPQQQMQQGQQQFQGQQQPQQQQQSYQNQQPQQQQAYQNQNQNQQGQQQQQQPQQQMQQQAQPQQQMQQQPQQQQQQYRSPQQAFDPTADEDDDLPF